MNIAKIIQKFLLWSSACALSGGALLAAVPQPPVDISAKKLSTAVVIGGKQQIVYSAELEWKAAPKGTRATGYRIYYKGEDDSMWRLLAFASGSTWRLRDTQIPLLDKEHFFYITAYNKDGESSPGDTVAVSFRNSRVAIIPAVSFVSSPLLSAVAGSVYEYKAQAATLNGGDVYYSVHSAVKGATIDRETGVLLWKPEQPGDYTFTVQAVLRKNPAKSAVQTWTVRVPAAVEIPDRTVVLRFVNSPDEEAIVYSPYVYKPQMSRAALTDVTYSLTEAPDGAEVREDGTIVWTPAAAGEYTFLLRASARTSKARSQTLMSWTVRVYDERGGKSDEVRTSVGGYGTSVSSVKAYPNPATSELFVQFDAAGASVVALTDENGRELYSRSQPAEHGITTVAIDVTGFAAGRYYVRIETGNRMQAIPVAIVR